MHIISFGNILSLFWARLEVWQRWSDAAAQGWISLNDPWWCMKFHWFLSPYFAVDTFISTYYDIWRLLSAFHAPGASRKVDSWRLLSTVQIGFHLVALLCVCGCVQHDFWLAKLVVDCPLRLWSTHWMYYAWFQLLEGQLGNVFCVVLVLCVDGTYKCTKNGRGSYKSSFIYGIHVRHSFHHWKYLS